VAIATVSRTEDSGFESRRGVGFLGLYIAVLFSKLKMHCHCVHLRKINASKKEKKERKLGAIFAPKGEKE
jgi:hypothetical protein